MTPFQIVSQLAGLGARLEILGDNLRCLVPKGVKLPTEILAEIKDQKPQLLSYLLALKPTLALIRSAREGQLPLSFSQQRLWFLSQLQPDSALYNLPVAVRLSGHLDSEALQQALT
ncbi:hypothetical protein CDH05_26485, partial [Pseudomonas lactis]|uniref:condensation domain-containing protein n=1 Tax=Pseudomonas lactis TaxID=1615674 RepID=UPI000B6E3E61